MAVSARNVAPPPPPTTEEIAAHIDDLWVALAADPGQRAMAVARLCMAAPELAPDARALCRGDIHVVHHLHAL